METMLETIPPYRIVYIRQIGPYGINNVQAMEKLKNWANANNLLNDEAIILGIAQDNPGIIKPEHCRYDTCVVIPKDYAVTDEHVKTGDIAGGRYLVFKISHTAEAVQQAWLDIFPELARQGHRFDEARPIIERYIVKLVNMHYCEICVPIY